jgi:hypothetical protein
MENVKFPKNKTRRLLPHVLSFVLLSPAFGLWFAVQRFASLAAADCS